MATVTSVSVCPGGEHITVRVMTSLGARELHPTWSEIAAAKGEEEIIQTLRQNIRTRLRIDGVSSGVEGQSPSTRTEGDGR